MDFIEVFEYTFGVPIYESVDVIDVWESLRIERNFTKPDSLTLVIVSTEKNIRNLLPRNYLLVGNKFFEIASVKSDENLLMVKARSMSQKLDQRFELWSVERNNTNPEIIAHELVARAIQSPFWYKINQPEIFTNTKIRYASGRRSGLENLSILCETYQFGYTEKAFTLERPSCEIDIIPAKNLADKVVFSTNNEILLSEDYERDYTDYKNVAWVFGEGEGYERTLVKVDQVDHVDIRNLYVDARDLRREVSEGVLLTEQEYEDLLYQRGIEKLAEHAPIFSLSGTIDAKSKLFKLGVDYDVGDIVTIESEKFNIKTNLQITSIQETWDSAGYHIDPVFGRESPTIFEKLRR